MGVLSYIKKQKESFQRERTTKKANKLADLRTERIRTEGRAKVSKAYDMEKARLKKAKKENFNRSFTGRALSGAKKLQSKSRARSSKRGVLSKNKSSLGSGFGSNINPAFSLGKEKPKEKKPETITIKIQR